MERNKGNIALFPKMKVMMSGLAKNPIGVERIAWPSEAR